MNKAILFLIFNRIEYTKQVFEQIALAQPPRLYIASDGPRSDVNGEVEEVEKIRKYVLDNINWDCQVNTLFRDSNLSCGRGIYESINWFFEHEKDGIILEDDTVPNLSFFEFCETLLNHYEDDKRIWHISGSNFINLIGCEDSYYFSKIMHGWGWATWRDRWENMDFDLVNYNRLDLKKLSDNRKVTNFWHKRISEAHEIVAWDYQWVYTIVKNSGLAVVPAVNLISNIGVEGVHFKAGSNCHRLNRLTEPMGQIKHPEEVKCYDNVMDKIHREVFGVPVKLKRRSFFDKIFGYFNTKETPLGIFRNFNETDRSDTSIGYTTGMVLKWQNYRNFEKLNSVKKEAEIIKLLNSKNAISAPKLIADDDQFMVMERVNDTGKYSLPDLFFALLEQKKIGVWHGDMKPANQMFNGDHTVLIDYDQARYIPEIIEMDNIEFLNFIANDLETKWKGYLVSHFGTRTVEDFVNSFKPYMRLNSFDLGSTTIFKRQITTISDTGFYHTIDTKDAFIDGQRDLGARLEILDKINIQEDEKILDFGCNAGLLSFYLNKRGAIVSGCDMDDKIITAAKALNNIFNQNVNFFKCDIDYEKFENTFDTICMFSVIHHTKYMEENAAFLASKCRRIIIECRLNEVGQKPTKSGWIYTSKWKFNTIQELQSYLESLFPQFVFEKIWGQGDRDRYIMTLLKQS